MEVFWLCDVCDSTNNYTQTTVCNVCGNVITSQAEVKCKYEIAEYLYENAVTSSDFLTAAEQYYKVIDYSAAKKKYNECHIKAKQIAINEEIYKQAKIYLNRATEYNSADELDEAKKAFDLAEQEFKKIPGFQDADQKAIICRRGKELCNNKQVYFSAKAILTSASSIEDYQKAADLFAKILQFTDAQEKYDICLKAIKDLKAKKQYNELLQKSNAAEAEADLDKKIAILQNIISFESSSLSVEATNLIKQSQSLLEKCLKKKKAIQTNADLNRANKDYAEADLNVDYTVRVKAFERLLTKYQSYSRAPEFSLWFKNCRNKIDEAKKGILYEKALLLMNNATTVSDYQKAAEAFAKLNFKDSNERKDECLKQADYLTKENKYQSALETYEKGRSINIINWKKYV